MSLIIQFFDSLSNTRQSRTPSHHETYIKYYKLVIFITAIPGKRQEDGHRHETGDGDMSFLTKMHDIFSTARIEALTSC